MYLLVLSVYIIRGFKYVINIRVWCSIPSKKIIIEFLNFFTEYFGFGNKVKNLSLKLE